MHAKHTRMSRSKRRELENRRHAARPVCVCVRVSVCVCVGMCVCFQCACVQKNASCHESFPSKTTVNLATIRIDISKYMYILHKISTRVCVNVCVHACFSARAGGGAAWSGAPPRGAPLSPSDPNAVSRAAPRGNAGGQRARPNAATHCWQGLRRGRRGQPHLRGHLPLDLGRASPTGGAPPG